MLVVQETAKKKLIKEMGPKYIFLTIYKKNWCHLDKKKKKKKWCQIFL